MTNLGRYTCIGIAALAYAVVGTFLLVTYAHPEHEYPVMDVEVQDPLPHRPVQEYEVE